MKFCFNDLLSAVSKALDCVEKELVGVSTDHARRVACLCIFMGKQYQMTEKELSDLAGYALLHDNALTEYIQSELKKGKKISNLDLPAHCIYGERNVKEFPFFKPCENAILYHHECADGSGPFGKKQGEIPLYAAMIHLADQIDARFNLRKLTEEKLQKAKDYVENQQGREFGQEESQLFFEGVTLEALNQITHENVGGYISVLLPSFEEEFTPEALMRIAKMFAKIVDYKSTFTSLHSMGIAERVWKLGNYYGFNEEKKAKLYLAGGLHDIGKLAIDNAILEKPGKLTAEEFEQMKRHAVVSYEILHEIRGFEEITEWAAYHHEKLNGQGYPFGYGADKLGRESRMMACVDIYQALSEKRPYKSVKSHAEIMEILYTMVSQNALDEQIVKDMDIAFRESTCFENKKR